MLHEIYRHEQLGAAEAERRYAAAALAAALAAGQISRPRRLARWAGRAMIRLGARLVLYGRRAPGGAQPLTPNP